MATAAKIEATPLAKLREPFADHHISKLPKPTKAQTEAVRADFKSGIRCKICGSWHHPDVIHLDYVGHAALTDRLLDTDLEWSWEPLAYTELGLPAFDQTGGLWIKLTVAGVTRLGYGHAAAKPNADPGSREKEVIGDALRNAAMRFGAALDLWHKGDLHPGEDAEETRPAANDRNGNGHQAKTKADRDAPFPQGPAKNKTELKEKGRALWADVMACEDRSALDALLASQKALVDQLKVGLPQWWNGGTRDGESYEGLGQVIDRLERDFEGIAATGTDWRGNPILAG